MGVTATDDGILVAASIAPLADIAPHDAVDLARRLHERNILIKPSRDPVLGPGFMRVTTALPEDNEL